MKQRVLFLGTVIVIGICAVLGVSDNVLAASTSDSVQISATVELSAAAFSVRIQDNASALQFSGSGTGGAVKTTDGRIMANKQVYYTAQTNAPYWEIRVYTNNSSTVSGNSGMRGTDGSYLGLKISAPNLGGWTPTSDPTTPPALNDDNWLGTVGQSGERDSDTVLWARIFDYGDGLFATVDPADFPYGLWRVLNKRDVNVGDLGANFVDEPSAIAADFASAIGQNYSAEIVYELFTE